MCTVITEKIQMKNKKFITILIIAVLALIAITLWFIKFQYPHIIAVKNYNAVVDVINKKNAEIDKEIEKLQKLIDSEETPLDDTIIDTSKSVIKNAEAEKVLIDEMPKKTKEIVLKTTELNTPIDYTDVLEQLKDTFIAFETSIKQYKQFIKPSEEFVIQRLLTIDEVKDVRAVTEDNDPNGHLNKPGGYTATVYFESSNVNQANVYGTDLIDKGTDAGGAIEVYANADDAIKREEYLATFDGGILASGSHKVVGTVLIRTSNELTATNQKLLEEKIINALGALQ